MKKHLFGFWVLSLLAFLVVSCNKQDDADAFVGTYSASATATVTSGGTTYSNATTGTMHITKISANRVQTSGWFNTYGEIVGNAIYLESCSYNVSDFMVTNVFGVGTLNGNVLTFSCTTSGKTLSYGTWYPYYSSSQHTCIKQPR